MFCLLVVLIRLSNTTASDWLKRHILTKIIMLLHYKVIHAAIRTLED